MPTLRELFDAHRGRPVGKIDHFFDDYEVHLAPFRGRSPKVLEIGVDRGGSLEMWVAYFGAGADVHGVDIDPAALRRSPPDTTVHIGSQADETFLRDLADRHGPFDVVIDDGSHVAADQILTFECLYPAMSDDGVYICEDVFTSYWSEYGGGVGAETTFLSFARDKVDELHGWWTPDEPAATGFTAQTRSITFLSGAVVFQRSCRTAPTYVTRAGDRAVEMSVAELHRAARRSLAPRSTAPEPTRGGLGPGRRSE